MHLCLDIVFDLLHFGNFVGKLSIQEYGVDWLDLVLVLLAIDLRPLSRKLLSVYLPHIIVRIRLILTFFARLRFNRFPF